MDKETMLALEIVEIEIEIEIRKYYSIP